MMTKTCRNICWLSTSLICVLAFFRSWLGWRSNVCTYRHISWFFKQTLKRLRYKDKSRWIRTTTIHFSCNVCRPHLIGHFHNFEDHRLLLAKQDCGTKKKGIGCKTGGMRLSSSPFALLGIYMHVIQFRHSKLRFLALMWIWMQHQLSRLPQSIAGQVMLAILESGLVPWWADMGGHGSFPRCCLQEDWRYLFFLKYHMRAIAHHAFIRAMGYIHSHVHARTHAPVQRKCSICPIFPHQYIYIFSHHASYGVHPMHLQDPWHWLDASRPEL